MERRVVQPRGGPVPGVTPTAAVRRNMLDTMGRVCATTRTTDIRRTMDLHTAGSPKIILRNDTRLRSIYLPMRDVPREIRGAGRVT
jgi:hypothetical protein